LSFAVGWYSLHAAEEIIKSAPNNDAFNLQKRVNDNLGNK
jgi:hypothetical protein